MLADAWATAMLILGREKGLEIAKAHNVAGLFVERDTATNELRFKSEASDSFMALTA
jgi:thiamine biosynthesis lipoprotein